MRITIIPAALVCLLAAPASAHEMRAATLPGAQHTLYVNADVVSMMPDHYDRLQVSAAKVDMNASAMRFTLEADDDASAVGSNGENEVDIAEAYGVCSGDNPVACALLWCSGASCNSASGTIIETDVIFDIDHPWVTNDLKDESYAYDSSEGRPLVNTAIHEFAHTLGVMHEADVFQIMGNAWNVVNTNGDHTETVLSEDTTKGLVETYGARSSDLYDVSLYHWEWKNASSGGYSKHKRTKVMFENGNELPEVDADEPTYLVQQGQTIKVRQTAENRGTSTESVKIKWYLSTNDYISSSDTLLETKNYTLGVNTPYTFNRNVDLPSNLTLSKSYWIGAIIDANDALDESNEANNAVYVARLIPIFGWGW